MAKSQEKIKRQKRILGIPYYGSSYGIPRFSGETITTDDVKVKSYKRHRRRISNSSKRTNRIKNK